MDGLLGNGHAFQEDFFQRRMRALPWFSEFKSQYGEEPDLNTSDYNYRAAMAAGLRPERDKYDPTSTEAMNQAAYGVQPQGTYHWPSAVDGSQMLKSEDHRTAWKEHFMRLYGVDPDSLSGDRVQQMMRGAAYKPPPMLPGLL